MAERLDLDAGGRHGRDLVHRELAAAGDTGDAELPGGQERAGRSMHARLGRQVNLDVSQTTTQLGDEPEVGHDQRIGARFEDIRRQRDRLVQLVIAHEDVEGDVQASAAAMTQAGSDAQLVEREVGCRRARVKGSRARVDGIGAGGDGRRERLQRPGRRKQLR